VLSLLIVALGLSVSAPDSQISETCFKDCRVSESDVTMTVRFEGYMPYPYVDPAGIPTVGYGHVIRPSDKLTYPLLPPDASGLLMKDMSYAANGVNKSVKVPLNKNQFIALVDFSYNAGIAALQSSTLLKKVNAQKHDEVYPQFLRWTYATISGMKVQLNGLVVRRKSEADMYAK